MSIIKKEAYFNSSNGKNKIRTLIWSDEKASPIGVVQIAHGSSEHIGRYEAFANFLAENGFVVCGNDHLGHGKSVDTLDELGSVEGEDGWLRTVDDMHILHNIMAKRYPDLPYFLFGHSMGSFAARIYSARFGSELKGAIFCGTGQIPAAAAFLRQPLDIIVQKLGEAKNVSALVRLVTKAQSLQYEKEGGDELAWLARNPATREEFAADPLCGAPMKASGLRSLCMLALKASEPDWASRLPKDLPIMMISGGKDPIGQNGRGVISVAVSLEQAGIEPTVILYPGDRHEILNELDREAVFRDVLKWLYTVLANT